MTEQPGQGQPVPENPVTPEGSEELPQGRGGRSEYQFTQDDVNKYTGKARAEAKAAREREIAESLGVSVEEAAQIIKDHQAAQEANQTELQKAQGQVEKLKTQLNEAQTFKERAERAEAVISSYAESLREGLDEGITTLLNQMDPTAQLQWLVENGHKFKQPEEPQQTGPRPIRRAPDATPQPASGGNGDFDTAVKGWVQGLQARMTK